MENKKRNIQPFNGERYSVWKFRVRSLLSEMQVLDVIDKEEPGCPDEEWQKKNLTARNVIIEYLADSLLNYAKEDLTAKIILQNLDNIYERRSLASQLTLRSQLLNLKLQGDMPLLQHFTLFEDIVTELQSAGAKLEEMDKIAHLLLTLPSTYDGVITALQTLGDEQLNLAFVKTRLLDHEVKLKGDTKSTALKVLHFQHQEKNQNAPGPSGTNRNKRKYEQSNKGKFHQKYRHYKTSNISCDHCGRRNHLKKDCYFYKKTINQPKNQPSNNIQYVETNSNQDQDQEQGSFAFMFMEDGSMSDRSNNDTNITFLLDSGATDHVVNTNNMFTTYEELSPPLKIGVAKNGVSVLAVGKGSINITTNMGVEGRLDNVLYSPELPQNLLSVNRIQAAGMTVIFDNQGASVFNNNHRIITGKKHNCLFKVVFGLSKIKKVN